MNKTRRREKIRYEIDHLNRLWMEELDADGLPLGPRIALEGSFKTRNNVLLYRLKAAPQLEEARRIPRQLHLTGQWSLTSNHDLALTLDQASSQEEGDRLLLKGNFLYAESDALGFSFTTRQKETERTQTLRLEGKWEADPQNLLTFHVEKEKGEEDILRLESSWEVGKQNELIYRYEKRLLAEGPRREETLTFKGFWEVSAVDRLTYRLDVEGDSAFHFRAALQSHTLLAKEGAIRYQIGIELSGRRKPLLQTVTLFGKWKLNRNLSLDFELTPRGEGPQRIRFGTSARFLRGEEVSFFLEDEEGRPLGMEVRFKKRELGPELFMRLKREKAEDLIEAGGRVPF